MATQAQAGDDTVQADREEILARHKDWWEANAGLDIPRMANCFPKGMNYLMFNLNGHPYFGLDEKVKLWEWYTDQLDITMGDIRIMKFEISGDMAWIGCEGIFPLRLIGAEGTGSETWQVDTEKEYDPFRLRATEIYRRDDGEGNPVWKMWHFHASPLPPEDELRPCFNDTARERGLGYNPWGEPLRVVGT
jgi:ketosteroid isomerase-like protein